MNDELVKLFEFNWDTKSNFVLPKESIEQIRSKKFDKVKVVVYGNPESSIKNTDINFDLYSKIKKVQGLPGQAVLSFLISKGSIQSDKFKRRLVF